MNRSRDVIDCQVEIKEPVQPGLIQQRTVDVPASSTVHCVPQVTACNKQTHEGEAPQTAGLVKQ